MQLLNQSIKRQLSHLAVLLGCCFAFFVPHPSYAETNTIPLTSEQAFSFSLSFENNNQVMASWHIAPGYYLYRERFGFAIDGKKLTNVNYPQGDFKYDTNRGRYEVFSNDVFVPLIIDKKNLPTTQLTVNYQGCAEDGFCYPPITKNFTVNVMTHTITEENSLAMTTPPATNNSLHALATQQTGVQHLLATQHFAVQLLILAALGLLLAFTPCVLPMIPILTSIIVGQKNNSTRRAFFLSLTYVLGTAITYAVAGLAAALMGSSLQVWLQTPIVVGIVCLVFVMLSLSLFGLFDLRLPNSIHNALSRTNNGRQGGTYAGVFAMGMISTLIVSPCVTAPLVGVLLYIAQTGDVVLGASALFVLGLGMGLPLLVIGVSAGKWLPKSGPWMMLTKYLFGFLMLAMAIWLSSRILSPAIVKTLVGCLLIIIAAFCSFYLPRFSGQHAFNRIFAIAISVCGLLLIAGGTYLPQPVNNWFSAVNVAKANSNFTLVRNVNELNQQIALAKAQNKSVILDFYADWCESCIAMEKNVFDKPNVKEALSNYVLLRADLSANSSDDEALLKYYNVVAPPTVLFFSGQGQEANAERIVGEVTANEFLTRLNSFGQNVALK